MVDRLVEKCLLEINGNQWLQRCLRALRFFFGTAKVKTKTKKTGPTSQVFFCFFWIENLVSHKISSKANDACMHRPKKREGMRGLMVTAERTERCLTETRKTSLE